MSRRDLRHRIKALERKVDPRPIRPSCLLVPNYVWNAGDEAIRAWVREEIKKYEPVPRTLVIQPDWEDYT